jgi:hypothetical protein
MKLFNDEENADMASRQKTKSLDLIFFTTNFRSFETKDSVQFWK